MRYRKTPQNERKTYKIFNEQGKLIAELNPDENGVTADIIKKLHALDDHEVYVNCKELRIQKYLMEYEISQPDYEEPGEAVMLLRELITQFPKRWQEVYKLSMRMEYSNVKTAQLLGITEARVRALKKIIAEKIRSDEEIKKFFL